MSPISSFVCGPADARSWLRILNRERVSEVMRYIHDTRRHSLARIFVLPVVEDQSDEEDSGRANRTEVWEGQRVPGLEEVARAVGHAPGLEEVRVLRSPSLGVRISVSKGPVLTKGLYKTYRDSGGDHLRAILDDNAQMRMRFGDDYGRCADTASNVDKN